ncbi:hypothetical protein KVG96_17020 [Pseudomonas sp. COR58]|uniref:Uncharacterized protein n=1 Tax=Pseudomonas ekonensis TaxID=2842353 RepID=A0ABS6PI63_9PSED|nr:hypothetical protein [Pseudomonas ekonensis]MBV4459656.1 hypothetical protein [Pseudomonas ekonensis]
MSALQQCVEECRQCAGLFRLGRDVEAALEMVDVFEKAQRLMVGATPESQQGWMQVLTHMLACQERQDWLGLADHMECELVDLLQNLSG